MCPHALFSQAQSHMKKLMDDGVLSQEEFIKQKEIILQALHDL